jgi:hypothetical protein
MLCPSAFSNQVLNHNNDNENCDDDGNGAVG